MAADIYFDASFKVLICKIHGYGVHPGKEAIKRHLRGEGHHLRGGPLRVTISTLTNLPLNPLEVVINDQPTLALQPIAPPIPHLRVLPGWNCLPCAGGFLTTSLELVQRHAASEHGRKRGEPSLWEPCNLQTFFRETKDRSYFRVAGVPAATNTSLQSSKSSRNNRIQCVQVRPKGAGQKGKEISEIEPRATAMDISLAHKHISTTQSHADYLAGTVPPGGAASSIRSLTFRHPFTFWAEKYVKCVPVDRLDGLFKIDAFRKASEPLFDGSHVDAVANMVYVFPQCLEEPLFCHALLYSTVQIANRGRMTIEGLSLHRKTVILLNEKLASANQDLSAAVLGAIMILSTTAYKSFDVAEHSVHAQGLVKVLELFTRDGRGLTSGLNRAVFWLDLCASILIHSQRQMTYRDYHRQHVWKSEAVESLEMLLPIGFAEHQVALPQDLLTCICDTLELQATAASLRAPQYIDLCLIDTMQASLECRLECLAPECRDSGPIAEAVRLGVFICCYCSWMETWNDSLIPLLMAERLLDVLEASSTFTPENLNCIWLPHVEVLLWLLLINSSVLELDGIGVEKLRPRQRRLLSSVMSAWTALGAHRPLSSLERTLESICRDFIYVDGWLSRRHNLKVWFEMDALVSAAY